MITTMRAFPNEARIRVLVRLGAAVDGGTKQAALAALGACDFVKHVIVVDVGIDDDHMLDEVTSP